MAELRKWAEALKGRSYIKEVGGVKEKPYISWITAC